MQVCNLVTVCFAKIEDTPKFKDYSSAIMVSEGFTGKTDQIADDEDEKMVDEKLNPLCGSFERLKNISE